MKNKWVLLGLIVMLVVAMISGCNMGTVEPGSGGGADAPQEQGNASMPNPASVYCEEQGGTVEMRTSDAGEYGVCVFPDGSECDEWAFFEGACSPGEASVPTDAPAPKLVFGWYGRVVSTVSAEPFENYLALEPKGVGNVGLITSDAVVAEQLGELRDSETLVHIWGALVCEMADSEGCTLDVTRLRPDAPGPFFEPDVVDGWPGTLHSLPDGPRSGGDDFFMLDDPAYEIRYGIDARDPQVAAQLDGLRDQEVRFYIWGELTCGVPDAGGCQITVSRIEGR